MTLSSSALGRTFAAVMAAGALSLAALPAQATLIQMDQGGAYSLTYDYGGLGSGRGIGFVAGQSFSINSIGIDLGLSALATGVMYKFSIFSSTDGSDVGNLLAWTTFDDALEGEGWLDRPIDFEFTAGNFYVVNFSRADGLGFGGGVGTHYSWENQGAAPHTYGPLTVLDGFEGVPPDSENQLVPHMRFDADIGAAVPEPASWALMIMGVGGMGAVLRRRRQAVAVA